MLAGVLTVLKIIGIVLLWILAIILAILLLILFVPIRYKLDGSVPETEFEDGFDAEKISCSARITWLLHFVSAVIAYPDNKEFTVKILGIKILPRPEKKDKDQDKKESEEKADSDDKDKNKEKDEIEEKVEPVEEETSEGNQDKEKSSESDNNNISYIEKSDMGDLEDKDLKDEDKALIEIVLQIIEKIENFLTTPLNVFENITYTISRLYDKIRMIKTTLENDIFKRAFELVKGKLIRLLKMIAPDKARVELKLGLGDPADTAEVMALYGAFYPLVFKKVSFEPDFDRKVIYADAHFKGHITVATVLYCVCVCYFNKDVKKVIRRFKKILNS